jgi:cell division protein FtsI (penicillin-binding protein 3)
VKRSDPGRQLWILQTLGLLLLLVLVVRAFQIQVLHHRGLAARAWIQHADTLTIVARRGAFLDRTGRRLRESLPNPSLFLDPQKLEDPQGLERELVNLGWVKPGGLMERLRRYPGARFLWLRRGWVRPDVAEALLARWEGVYQRLEPKRIDTGPQALRPLLGAVDNDGRPLSGLELALDRYLRGRDGRELRFVTGGLRPRTTLAPQVLEPPEPGNDVVLTLDARAQEILVRRLKQAVGRWHARSAMGLVMDPRSGEILAMASVAPAGGSGEPAVERRLRVLCDQWEPGSTFKTVTFALALEAGVLEMDELLDCEDGLWRTEAWKIRDHERYGMLSARDVLVHSSNVGAAKIALRLDPQGFYSGLKRLGFGQTTGIPFPGEAGGHLAPPQRWSRRSQPTMGFGQEIAVTALQLSLFYAAVANGGLLLKPLLVREVRDEEGQIIHRGLPRVVRRVLEPTTCAVLRRTLREVVERGTGRRAEIPWFPPAGKTGTAQLYDPETGRYSDEDYMASFVGFAPWDDPRYLCLVAVEAPEDSIYGGQVAAPVFRAILEDLAATGGYLARRLSLDLPPRDDVLPVPDVRGLAPDRARQILKAAGLLPVLEGRGLRIRAMDPAPGTVLRPGSPVRLYPGGKAAAAGTMPDLRGQSVRRALQEASRLGLRVRLEGVGWIRTQEPAPGTPVHAGGACRLVASPSASAAWTSWLRRWQEMAHVLPGRDAD